MALVRAVRVVRVVLLCAAAPVLTGASLPLDTQQSLLGSLDPAEWPAESPAAAVPAGPVLDTAVLRTAIEAYRRGDLAAGDAAARSLDDTVARTLLEWVAIRHIGKEVGVDRIEAFVAQNRDWPMQATLRRRWEEALLATRPDSKRIRAAFRSRQPVTAWGKVSLAKALVEDNRMTEAAALVRGVWRNDDLSSDMETRVLEAFPELIEAADHRARLVKLIYDEDWSAAARLANRVGADWAGLVKAASAADKAPSTAAALLDGVAKPLQTEPSYLFAKAKWLRRTDKPVEAARLLASLTRDHPALGDGEAWLTERRILSRKLLDTGERRLAYEVARGAPATGPAAARLDAEFQAGWIALRFLDDPAAAARHFAETARIASTPVSVSRAAYWQGRAAEALGQGGEEHYRRAAHFATTFYGQLARTRLDWRDVPLRRVLKGEIAIVEPRTAVRAVRLLYEADQRDLAIPLLADLAQTAEDPLDLDGLAGLVQSKGDARAQLVLGKGAMQRGLPLEEHAFPLSGIPEVEPGGRPVERPMVFAIARQESAFDPRAVSSAGARGLMQLMPATARQTASRVGMGFDAAKLTADPAYNVRLGASHLGDLLVDWKGSYVLAIAAYNAGGGNVRKWIEAYGDPRSPDVDPVDWVERIPFNETRNYVQRVFENLQVYRARLGMNAELAIDLDLRRGVPRIDQDLPASPR